MKKTIYKKFFYYLFKLRYGNIRLSKDFQKKLFTKEIIFFKKKNLTYAYSIFLCPGSRLYTNRIQDTAIIKNNYLLDGPFFQLRNNIFDKDIKKNIVLKIGTPYIAKKINGTILSLLTGVERMIIIFIGYST